MSPSRISLCTQGVSATIHGNKSSREHMDVLNRQREQLGHQLQSHQLGSPPALPSRDPYLLVSALQKSLRRADRRYALPAAYALLEVDPARFWRRLVIVAFEDFGRADLDLTAEVVAAASDKRWRLASGGDWHVASYLVERLIALPRDRFLDELGTFADALGHHTAISAEWRDRGPSEPLAALMTRVSEIVRTCEVPIPGRGGYSPIAGACDRTLRAMLDVGILEADLLAVCAQGRRTTQCILPVLLPPMLDAVSAVGDPGALEVTAVPPVRDLGGLPSYAFDGYTRAGRGALWELYAQHHHLHGLWPQAVPARERIDRLQFLLFDVEGGLATEALAHPLLAELKTYSVGCGSGLTGTARQEALCMVREVIPLLNGIRGERGQPASPRGTQP